MGNENYALKTECECKQFREQPQPHLAAARSVPCSEKPSKVWRPRRNRWGPPLSDRDPHLCADVRSNKAAARID